MTLIPWKRMHKVPVTHEAFPVSPFDFRPELDRLVGRLFSEPWFSGRRDANLLTPSMDISEGEKNITIRVELPGIDPDAVDLTLCGNVMTISGEKNECTEDEGEDFYHCERRFGSFRRSIELPDTADLDEIKADEKNGVLTITVAKVPAASPRHIEVKASKPASKTRPRATAV